MSWYFKPWWTDHQGQSRSVRCTTRTIKKKKKRSKTNSDKLFQRRYKNQKHHILVKKLDISFGQRRNKKRLEQKPKTFSESDKREDQIRGR